MKGLSSYAEGAELDQPEAPSSPGEESSGNPEDPTPETPPAPADAPPVEEDNPLNVPLEPAPTNATPEPASNEPASNEPASNEPTETASEPESAEPPSTEPAPSDPALTPTAVDEANDCAALGGFTIAATSSCYRLGDTTLTWQDARTFCEAWGGDLVAIGSAEENAELAQNIDGSAWIGAIDPEEDGVFVWAAGDPFDYVAWGFGQPNNLDGLEHCVELRAFDDLWSDVPCTDDFARQALCERPPSM